MKLSVKGMSHNNPWYNIRSLARGTIKTSALIMIGLLAIPPFITQVQAQNTPHSVVLYPSDDGHVNKADPTEDYGTDKEVKSDANRSAYIKYDLTGYSSLAVTKAEVRFYTTESSRAVHTIKHVTDTTWKEESLIYQNRPVISQEVIATITGPQKGKWYTVDVTAAVKAQLGKKWSIAIENAPGKYDSFHFSSRNNKTLRPELVLYTGSVVAPTRVPTTAPTRVPSITKAPTSIPTAAPTRVLTVTPTRTPTPTRIPTVVQPSPTSAPGQAQYPGDIINLRTWKLTLPSGSNENPTEIKEEQLWNDYSHPQFFFVNGQRNGVVFRAPVNGVTTSGSDYPRSELREMNSTGEDGASWSSTSGTHTMFIDQAITAVPQTKQHVVAGQIHDSSDDLIVIRLEGSHLFINTDSQKVTLTNNYVLGTRFNVTFEVSGGQTRVYYNGVLKYTMNMSYSGAYFKAGAYTQSNCSRETVCSASNYGEVVIYNLQITHN